MSDSEIHPVRCSFDFYRWHFVRTIMLNQTASVLLI